MSPRDRIVCLATGVLLSVGVVACTPAHAQAKPQKKVYCWNENGRKICGDALPAEEANSARTEISAKSGLATGQVARALNEAEQISAAASAEVARKQAEVEALQQRRDLAMVESYMTEADLRRAYGERTNLLDETVKASQLGLVNQRLSLITLLRQAGDWELDKKPVPGKLAASILKQHDDLIHQQQILADQQLDRATLNAELADAVRRYRELKTSQTGDAPTPAAAPPTPTPGAG